MATAETAMGGGFLQNTVFKLKLKNSLIRITSREGLSLVPCPFQGVGVSMSKGMDIQGEGVVTHHAGHGTRGWVLTPETWDLGVGTHPLDLGSGGGYFPQTWDQGVGTPLLTSSASYHTYGRKSLNRS